MLDLSIGELDALVVKAYRGAGFSWGYAQEAGVAAAWLAIRGLPSAAPIARLLPAIDGVSSSDLMPVERNPDYWRGSGESLCPVMTGCVVSDFGLAELSANATLTIRDLLCPIVLIPAIARLPGAYLLTINTAQWRCGQNSLERVSGGVEETSDNRSDVTIAASTAAATSLPGYQRVQVDASTLAVLHSFAHRTYVPATEASRIAGAGAGLLDND